MKIVAYLPEYNDKLSGIVKALARGIPGCECVPLGKYVDADIAIIFGGYKEAYKPTWPKKEIMEKHQGRRLIMIESGFFKRGDYYQVGFGGFAGDADFNNKNSRPDRWNFLGVNVKPWRVSNSNGPIFVMGQVPWDTQVQHMDHIAWCQEAARAARATGRQVFFKPHPKVRDRVDYGLDEYVFDGKIEQALDIAGLVVTYNSTSSIDALIAGVPVVCCDKSAMAWPMAAHGLENIGNPVSPDRRQFFYDLAYAMWTPSEMANGTVWEHLMRD